MNNKPNNTHDPRHPNELDLKGAALDTLVHLAMLEAEDQTIILADEIAGSLRAQGRPLSKRELLKSLNSLLKAGYISRDDQGTPPGYRMTEKGWDLSALVVRESARVMDAMCRIGWMTRINVGGESSYELTQTGRAMAVLSAPELTVHLKLALKSQDSGATSIDSR